MEIDKLKANIFPQNCRQAFLEVKATLFTPSPVHFSIQSLYFAALSWLSMPPLPNQQEGDCWGLHTNINEKIGSEPS
ncbi:hypothetical protein E2562_036410 [Oryza meyeriana var. granulata]|uniref:Uncharacterized protein n=1 Tax=Oryza meyeriana var. granulata TaxID=110450 RepID=A0A6G1E7L6_9ORYZ|nr:hypothetical protein E2562_036410 [Oryza meyeriana var. granulata]